jgi:hypothetical protein
MRTLALIAIALGVGSIAVYMTTCSVNNTPAAAAPPAHPIVGKWKQVLENGRPVMPGRGTVLEYKADGVVVFGLVDEGGNWTHEYGHYVVNGNCMDVTMPLRIERSQFIFDFTFVTPNRLAATNVSLAGLEEYIRLEK